MLLEEYCSFGRGQLKNQKTIKLINTIQNPGHFQSQRCQDPLSLPFLKGSSSLIPFRSTRASVLEVKLISILDELLYILYACNSVCK
nr:hypothetical protein Itr_chr03CG10680 [Ipomoea trifida]